MSVILWVLTIFVVIPVSMYFLIEIPKMKCRYQVWFEDVIGLRGWVWSEPTRIQAALVLAKMADGKVTEEQRRALVVAIDALACEKGKVPDPIPCHVCNKPGKLLKSKDKGHRYYACEEHRVEVLSSISRRR
jgi:hypothetical protein